MVSRVTESFELTASALPSPDSENPTDEVPNNGADHRLDGNLVWQALKSIRIRTLLYSSIVAVIGSLSFGYTNGFSSPATPDLDKDHGSFNNTLDHDLFNVSHNICMVACEKYSST